MLGDDLQILCQEFLVMDALIGKGLGIKRISFHSI